MALGQQVFNTGDLPGLIRNVKSMTPPYATAMQYPTEIPA